MLTIFSMLMGQYLDYIIKFLLLIKATESIILGYHFLYKSAFKGFFTPRNCKIWLILPKDESLSL